MIRHSVSIRGPRWGVVDIELADGNLVQPGRNRHLAASMKRGDDCASEKQGSLSITQYQMDRAASAVIP